MRGEIPKGHGRPKRARSWKRRIQPRKTYSLTGSPLLGVVGQREKLNMPDWFWMVVVLAAYVLLTQWILPKLGVPT